MGRRPEFETERQSCGIFHVQQPVNLLSEAGCRLIQATSVGSRSIPSFVGFRDDIRDVGIHLGGSTKGKSVTHRLCASVQH